MTNKEKIREEFYRRFNNAEYEGTMWYLDGNIDIIWEFIEEAITQAQE